MDFIKDIKPIIDLLTALTSPLIAVIVTYIAYQQWKINAKKESRESQHQKLEIYMSVKRFLQYFDEHLKVDKDLYRDLQESIALADFIFDSEVTEWLFNVEIEASSWLDTNNIALAYKGDNLFEQMEKELTFNKKSEDKLQTAHCQLLDVFKNKILTTKA
jgi:hypothetical protein